MDKILEKLIITLKSSQTEFNNPSFLLPVVNITVAKYQAKCTGLNSNIPNTKLIGFYTASLALRFTDEWPKVKRLQIITMMQKALCVSTTPNVYLTSSRN